MRDVVKGSTDQSVVIRIVDSADGTPETGVAYNTSGIDLWYRREGAVKTSITEATLSALNDAHSDGGILHIGDGYYRLDLPDAAVATGANGVAVGGTVTGMVVIGCYVPLVNWNPYDSVRGGMTALPNAAADAAGGLPISDAGGLDLDVLLTDTYTFASSAKINTDTIITNTSGVAGNVENIQSRLPDALTANGNMKSDALRIGGTTQTGRDIGASVLLSSGTGAGQVKLSGGYVAPNWGDVGNPTTTVGLSGTTIATVTSAPDSSGVGTLIAALGTPSNLGSGATVAGNLTDISAQAGQIGTAGAGLTNIGDTRLANLDATLTSRTLATADYATATALGTVDTVVDGIAAQTVKMQFDDDDCLRANAEKIVGYAPKGNIDIPNDQFTFWAIPSNGTTTFTPFQTGAEVTLADSEDVYPADVSLTIDDTNSKDEYTVQWFRNGTPVTSGVTVPTLQAIKRADGTDLIGVSAMTQIGSTGSYKYDALTTERATAGEAVVIVVSATINGATRTWRKVVTRDEIEVPA